MGRFRPCGRCAKSLFDGEAFYSGLEAIRHGQSRRAPHRLCATAILCTLIACFDSGSMNLQVLLDRAAKLQTMAEEPRHGEYQARG
jgi:hypothetical protein